MLITGQSQTEKIPSDLQETIDRVREKSRVVFEKFPDAFDRVKTLMDESKSLEDYYEKFEAYLDGYLSR